MQCDGTPNTTTGNAAAREISFGTINIMGEVEAGTKLVQSWYKATSKYSRGEGI
jgi:hypothetical protein